MYYDRNTTSPFVRPDSAISRISHPDNNIIAIAVYTKQLEKHVQHRTLRTLTKFSTVSVFDVWTFWIFCHLSQDPQKFQTQQDLKSAARADQQHLKLKGGRQFWWQITSCLAHGIRVAGPATGALSYCRTFQDLIEQRTIEAKTSIQVAPHEPRL